MGGTGLIHITFHVIFFDFHTVVDRQPELVALLAMHLYLKCAQNGSKDRGKQMQIQTYT